MLNIFTRGPVAGKVLGQLTDLTYTYPLPETTGQKRQRLTSNTFILEQKESDRLPDTFDRLLVVYISLQLFTFHAHLDSNSKHRRSFAACCLPLVSSCCITWESTSTWNPRRSNSKWIRYGLDAQSMSLPLLAFSSPPTAQTSMLMTPAAPANSPCRCPMMHRHHKRSLVHNLFQINPAAGIRVDTLIPSTTSVLLLPPSLLPLLRPPLRLAWDPEPSPPFLQISRHPRTRGPRLTVQITPPLQ